MRLLTLMLFCLVTACADTRGYESRSVHTGVTVTASDAYMRTVDRVSRVEARVVRLSMAERERFLIKVFVIRNDRNFPKITDAYSLGRSI